MNVVNFFYKIPFATAATANTVQTSKMYIFFKTLIRALKKHFSDLKFYKNLGNLGNFKNITKNFLKKVLYVFKNVFKVKNSILRAHSILWAQLEHLGGVQSLLQIRFAKKSP